MAANANPLPQEMIDLRDIVLPRVGLRNDPVNVAQRQTTQFIELHGLRSLDDFERLEPYQAKDLVKAYNARYPARSLGILVLNNLTGLIWYAKDMERRGLQKDPNAVDDDILRDGHLAHEAYVQNRDKGENIKQLEKWSEKNDFDDWDRKVTETLSLVYGRQYCPLAYVIRPDKPAGWDPMVDATNDYERLMYQLPLNGTAYNRDNEAVFSYIQLAVLQTPAETWIFDAVAGRDGRAAMEALRLHYEGDAELDVRATKAQQTLDTLTYSSERNMPFETMVTTLNKAYNTLKKQGQEFTDRSKVEQLSKRIKNPGNNIAVSVAINHMTSDPILKNNYTAATQYITSRMAQINSANVNAPGQRNARQISETDTDRNEYNGVDITDPFRTFTKDEWWRQLGKKGRELVEAKKKKQGYKNQRGGHGGGRGRGGRSGTGRGFGRRRGGRGGSNSPQDSANTSRNVNETNTNERASDNNGNGGGNNSSQQSVSTVSVSQASTNNDRGGQNGSRFGSNRL